MVVNITETTGTQAVEGYAQVAGVNLITAGAAITEVSLYDGSSTGNNELLLDPSLRNTSAWTAAAGWTVSGNGVAVHASGTGTLTTPITVVAGDLFKVVFTVSHSGSLTGSVVASIGGANGTSRSTKATFTEYIRATGTTTLTFTPSNDFDGTISAISVTKISNLANRKFLGKLATTAESKMINYLPGIDFIKGIFAIVTGTGGIVNVYID